MDRSALPLPLPPTSHEAVLDMRDRKGQAPSLPAPCLPEGTPNVLVVLIDDMGFGAPSVMGGPCRMPTAERLAAEGLIYTRFHTAALCAPTRAALLTGRNPHTAAMGGIPETATSSPGYTSLRPDSVASIARVLGGNGYATGAFGKMHGTPAWELSPTGPFTRWPTGEGFDKFYGFIGAESDHFCPPDLIDGTTRVDPPADEEGYHLSEDIVTRAVDWIDSVHTVEPEKPWFCYLSYGATHAPLHVPAGWRDRYRGEFHHGWNAERERIFDRQKELGLVPVEAKLPPWPEEAPRWDDCSDGQRVVAERLMELYAAFAEHTDAQTGRLVEYLDSTGQRENTLIFYILGDNGPSAEGGIDGTWNENLAVNGIRDTAADIMEHFQDLGGPLTFPQYPAGWALATSTPYQWTKQVASHYGGTRDGMVISWPAGIQDQGQLRHQWHHVVDVVPTILEAAGLPMPSTVDGAEQIPLAGVSFAYTFNDGSAEERHHTQYFEALGNRGIYHRGWTAVAKHRTPWVLGKTDLPPFSDDVWELYDTNSDWTQAENVAGEHPALLRKLQDLFHAEASRYGVFPLDDRLTERFNPALAGRRDLMGSRTHFTLNRKTPRLRENVAPNLKNVSHRITVEFQTDGTDSGVLIAQGGRFAGWTLYIHDNRLCYGYNFCGMERSIARSSLPLPAGMHRAQAVFDFRGEQAGGPAEVTLELDGTEVGRCSIPRTVAFIFSQDETLDVGLDRGTPVIEEYGPPERNAYSGDIGSISVHIGDQRTDPSEAEKIVSALIVH